MKRGPLKRSKGLDRGKPLERGDTPLSRETPLERKSRIQPKPKPKRTDEEAAASALWHRIVTEGKRCLMCGTRSDLQGHHHVPQQVLRRQARTLGVRAWVLVWDLRSGVPLCKRCHERHTLAVQKVPGWRLPAEAWEFAREIGLEHRLEREHP